MTEKKPETNGYEFGSLEALWDFEKRTLPQVKKYAGNMLFIRLMGESTYGFVGPSDPEYIEAVYDRHGKMAQGNEDDLIRAAIL